MNANATSLLVAEDEGSGVPALGGPATHLESEDYQSPLERLIAHSTSEQRGDPLSAPNDDNAPPLPERMVLWSPISSSSRTAALPTTNPSLVTLVACACCLLQMGLVWASFLAPSWLETRLYLSISLPSVRVETPDSQLLHTTTLGSLVGDLLGAGKHWAAMALVLTSLVLPCVSAVSAAVWIVEDRQEENAMAASVDECSLRRHPNRPKTCSHPRLFIEYFARIGFSIFFVLCILVLGSSPLEIEFNDSRFVVVNQMKGGLSSYTLGMIFGLLVLALLRFGRTNLQELFRPAGDSNRTEGEARRRRDLECSWRVRSNDLFTGIAGRHASKAEAEAEEELRTPLIQDETNNDRDTASVEAEPGGLSLWKRIVLYELGLTSTLLWIPALFLPLFHLKYEGIISDFMSEAALSFRLKDFPMELWQRGVSAGTNRFLLVVLDSVFMLLVFVFPAMANLTAIGTWLLDTKASEVCKRLLWILQPLLGALVFGTALYVSIPAFGTVTESAIDNVSSGLCSNFEAIAGDACFTIEAEPSTGLWFLLGEALALELFVVLTLRWH